MNRMRILVMLATLIATLSASSATALAGVQWCEEDPEFVVNGAIVDVTTLFDASYASSVSGSVSFLMYVPSNVSAAVISAPGTIPVTASVSRTLSPYYGIGQIPVVVIVSMKSTANFTTYTQITGLGGSVLTGVNGTSTRPTYASFAMYGF